VFYKSPLGAPVSIWGEQSWAATALGVVVLKKTCGNAVPRLPPPLHHWFRVKANS